MSNAMYFDSVIASAGSLEYPTERGRFTMNHFVSLSRQTIATDPIGVFALTLTNVVVGSAVQIEDQLGTTTLYNGTAATSSPLINLSCYAGGSTLNDIRIKIRKGSSAPFYIPWDTVTTAIVGSQSIYVAQISDQ